jgi:hypothetical protein
MSNLPYFTLDNPSSTEVRFPELRSVVDSEGNEYFAEKDIVPAGILIASCTLNVFSSSGLVHVIEVK